MKSEPPQSEPFREGTQGLSGLQVEGGGFNRAPKIWGGWGAVGKGLN